LGWCSVGLGFAGVFIPGLPTTIFIIVAAYLFARSSPRFEAWLLGHKWFGPRLRRYRETGGMSARAKRAALVSMWLAISLSALALSRVKMAAAVGTVALGVIGTLYILFGVKTVAD
jgi:uncharacterized membrane protein YbaN (DUF454 family)